VNRTLVITNDFPPRLGGIQSFVHGMLAHFPPGSVVVYAPSWPGHRRFDAAQPYPVIRHPSALMLPVPGVSRRARDLARAEGCTSVWFGAAAPLALLAPALRGAGAQRVVASTHGHEAGWVQLPGARHLLRRIGTSVDTLTYLGDYTRRRIGSVLPAAARERMVRLPPGVDATVFRPGAGGDRVRRQLGLADRPVVVCVSRLVARKGQDALIAALPAIRRRVADAALLLVGEGPYRPRLEALAVQTGTSAEVRFAGSVPPAGLPAYFAAGNVFAMPCRTRRAGLDVEGLGMVFLEASATGLPVVAGDSGGAPDAVVAGESGFVVDGRSVPETAERVAGLLADPAAAAVMGAKGRAWVEREWRWDVLSRRLQQLLGLRSVPPAEPRGAERSGLQAGQRSAEQPA